VGVKNSLYDEGFRAAWLYEQRLRLIYEDLIVKAYRVDRTGLEQLAEQARREAREILDRKEQHEASVHSGRPRDGHFRALN
jgi:hypothetical protein